MLLEALDEPIYITLTLSRVGVVGVVKGMEIFSRRAALYVLSMLALIGLLATAVLAYVEEDEDENVGVYSWAWAYVKGDI